MTEVHDEATMLFEICERILLGVHGEKPPTDRDWEGWISLTRQSLHRYTGILVLTDGAGPNSVQRARIAQVPAIAPLPTAIVTASPTLRGVVTAISWLGKNIRSFPPAHLDEAFTYLQVEDVRRRAILERVATLRLVLAGGSRKALEAAGMRPADIERWMDEVVTERLGRTRERLVERQRR